MPELKLIISHSDKVIQTVTKGISDHGFVKAIEDFQIVANSAMTKLIEDSGESGQCQIEEESDDSESEDDGVLPKKKKK